ncbi:hypothetical protein ZIOFF_074747 [Zingiber officinale]|uniref:Glycosyl transferase 48 domain-containing protein n=1 Tax=Zingiber officinale TaxID=94328 RepID=A0A8J5C5B3_ZINOF|nr:hypothetical protein ZIOFF_074747 [Zingiber officinale]
MYRLNAVNWLSLIVMSLDISDLLVLKYESYLLVQAFSGIGEAIQTRANVLQNTALDAALNTQFLFQIGVFTAIPMILGFILESGFLTVLTLVEQVTGFAMSCCRILLFYLLLLALLRCNSSFARSSSRSLLERGHTILAEPFSMEYRATGRGFVVRHIKFAENYRLYSRSHFVKGLEVVLLLIIMLAYGYNNGGAVSFILISVSSWIMALSWLFAPYLFNPSGFEWQKTVEDFGDWTDWLFYRGGIGVKGEESWEAWWDEELVCLLSWVMQTLLIQMPFLLLLLNIS